mgnify:CR=1 FL=1
MPQVVQLLRQQLAATSSQLDGLRRERDDARKAVADKEHALKGLDGKVGVHGCFGVFSCVQACVRADGRACEDVEKRRLCSGAGCVCTWRLNAAHSAYTL